MKKIIMNATPIISLSIIGRLSLITDLFDEIYIPKAVYREIVNSESNQDYGKNELRQAIEVGDFKLIQVENQQLVHTLYGKLHDGELEVIVAAKELGIQNVLLDERAARSLAKNFLLRPIGTVGILLLAKKRGKIDSIQPFLDQLIAKGIYLSKKLYQEVLLEAEEL